MESMEKINIDHSMKNVPIPPENEYKKVLVIKIEHFLRRFRWWLRSNNSFPPETPEDLEE